MKHAPEKPKFGSPCNGCGLCCAVSVCKIGVVAFGDIPAPCPAMQFEDGRFYCGLVMIEQAAIAAGHALEPILANALAIGKGCDSDD